MGRLSEIKGKNFLKINGISIPDSDVVSTPEEAFEVADRIGKTVVVKAQVKTGGRWKAGGVKIADTPEKAKEAAKNIIGMNLKGFTVKEVLVEEKLYIKNSYYAGIIPDSSSKVRAPVFIFSKEGGVDIEEVSKENIFNTVIDYSKGLPLYESIDILSKADIPNELLMKIASVISNMMRIFKKYDCSILEINPLVLTNEGKIVAEDCRMSMDENAYFRTKEMNNDIPRDFPNEITFFDKVGWWIEETDYRGSGYLIKLPPKEGGGRLIGYHSIGGGAGMIGIDALSRVNLKLANFADTSGNPVASKIYRVAKVIFSQPNIEGYLLAGFMLGNQEQWHHSHAMVKVLREELPKRPGFPCVLLLCGNKEEESLEILREGLKDLPGRIEIYGSERVMDIDFIGKRMLALVEDYVEEMEKLGGN